MTRRLALGTCDAVVVLHVHEYAIGRWGRAQVDCHEGAGGSVVDQVVSGLRDAGITVKGVIGSADYGHAARAILEAADQCDARMIVLGSSSRTRPAPCPDAGPQRASDGRRKAQEVTGWPPSAMTVAPAALSASRDAR